MKFQKETCLVSACLTGLCTRYDGQSSLSQPCMQKLSAYHWIPVCPEQLGGLTTPRPAADLIDGDGHGVLAGTAQVIDRNGNDLSESFIRGATMVLTIARQQEIRCCLLKAGSPSCGLTPRPGVTTALLLAHGFQVYSF